MPSPSPMLDALLAARTKVPEELQHFDALARAGQAPPSFEEYSARVGEQLSPWRETCYFDVATDPSLIAVANERFSTLASTLGFELPPRFHDAIHDGAVAGPEVLQIVLGIDAAGERTRLKYYLIFRDRSGATVERLRVALDAPALPATLQPDSVYILGIDFRRGQTDALGDFKIYVRFESEGVPRVIRNLAHFDALWRGSRYLVYQHCLVGGGRQVYFHASATEVLERWLRERSSRDASVAALREQIEAMNRRLGDEGHASLRPWIASFVFRRGVLLPSPSNVYFHYSA